MTNALLLSAVVLIAGCKPHKIPSMAAVGAKATKHLAGGTEVYADSFDRSMLGDDWVVEPATKEGAPDWKIVDGTLHSKKALNHGAWLRTLVPPGNVRIEYTARSEPRNDGKAFPGDLKSEAFASRPAHSAGYIFINGGWSNRSDVIARLDEHGEDRVIGEASKVLASRNHRYAIIRVEGTIHYFRDGERLLTFTDDDPLNGRYFGFNNWSTHVYYDDLKIFRL